MSLVSIHNLNFTYPGRYDPVFAHADAQLDTRWKLGLTGRNGRGKTTLLHLLDGSLDAGGAIAGAPGGGYFPGAVPDFGLPLGEAAATLCDAPDWQIARELGKLGLPPEKLAQPFGSLSPGEQTRALLAVLFLQPGAWPLIDEPTNHLDDAGRALLGRYLKSQKTGFLLISHDRALLDACCDHMLAIERTGLRLRQGNFSSWWQEVQDRDAREAAENERLGREIDRLQAAGQRATRWADKIEASKFSTRNSGLRVDRGYVGHKSAKMMQRAKAVEARRDKAIAEKQALFRDRERVDPLRLDPLPAPRGVLLRAADLSLYRGAQAVCGPLRFTLQAGDRLALTGPNGCGKTTLLRLVASEDIAHTGTLERPGSLVLSVVAQHSAPHGSVEAYAAEAGVDLTRLLTLLRKFGLERVQFEAPVESWSEGQRKKLALARSLCQRAHIYLWDEPLNYIDLYARMQIEAMLRESGATLLFVEHDRAFRQAVATGEVDLARV